MTITSTTATVCRTASNLVTVLTSGTCSIQAAQAGNSNYSAAATVTRSFNVAHATVSGTILPAPGGAVGAGSSPHSVTTGDFNNDGVPDLATANVGDNTLTILLGSGAGTYAAHSIGPFLSATGPVSVAAGHFNGDGKQDLAVVMVEVTMSRFCWATAPGISVRRQEALSVTVGHIPSSIVIGDFNSDGIQDIAVASSYENSVRLLLGNGSGGFTLRPGTIGVGAGPVAIVSADFNNDGKQDLATVNPGDNSVSILIGTGSAGFGPPQVPAITVGSGAQGIVIGDFNGDGKADFATANKSAIRYRFSWAMAAADLQPRRITLI